MSDVVDDKDVADKAEADASAVRISPQHIPRREKAEHDAAVAGQMYFSHEKIHPREVKGRFARLRTLAVFALLGAFYATCWISIDGQQILLFDLPARRFHIFGITLWPQDFIYLSAMLLLAALSLFFFTAVAGRLWCGYACPQTVWTELFMWIERWFEGPAARRQKLDRRAWDLDKVLRKGGKHIAWAALALFTGFTFVGYFTPIRELAGLAASFSLGPWELFWIGLYSLATWGNAGFLREQVCKYMCPYARFQSAMFDRNTLVISYDTERGEPRGSRRRGADPKEAGLGSCIDCHLCVQVCPTGIDIRDGLQYECIGCAACIDVCDDVMDKMGYPRGLVRYTTENALEGKPSRVLRPRVIAYGALIAIVSTVVLTTLIGRTPLIVDVMRDRNALFREVPGGLIENVYTLRIQNMDDDAHAYVISASGLDGVKMVAPEGPIDVAAGEVRTVVARLQVPYTKVSGSNDVEIEVAAMDAQRIRREETTRFLGPRRAGGTGQ
jgi:cytochrome c oxidase accessory protein FixG